MHLLKPSPSSSSQFRIEKALDQLIVEIQAGRRDGSRESAELICTTDDVSESAWREVLHDLEELGIPTNMAADHRLFIIAWIQKAVDEGRLQVTTPSSDRNRRHRGLDGHAEQRLSNPFLDGEPVPSYYASELENDAKRLAAAPLTIQARLVAVITLAASYRQESFERDPRSDGGKTCLNKATLLLEEVLTATRHTVMSEAGRIPWLTAMWNLGICYRDKRDYLSAIEVLKRVCEGWEDLMGSHAEETVHAACVLAGVYELAGEIDEAESLYLESLDAAQHQLGSDADLTLRIIIALARCLTNNWKTIEAESFYQEAYSRSIHVNGAISGFTAGTAHQLGVCYSRQGKLSEAVAMLSTAHAILLKIYGSNDAGTIASARMLGNNYFKLRAFGKARDCWANAISGHQVLGTLETPLGASLMQDCLNLGHQLGHANTYTLKMQRDPLGFLKTLGLHVDHGSRNIPGRSGQLKPPRASLPYLQRYPIQSIQGVEKLAPRLEQTKPKSDDDLIAAIASISRTGGPESHDWSPGWLDSEDPDFSAHNVLQAAKEWNAPYPQGAPEAAQIVLASSALDFTDTDRDGPPHQLVEALRTALLSLPQAQYKETNGGFRCLWNYSVVVDVNFVKSLVGGAYGLQFRKRGSAIKHGDSYYGLWMKVWDEVLSRRVTEALRALRNGSSETRLKGVQLFLQDKLREVSLMPSS